MYEDYWGLKEKPFENTPDPRFLYFSHDHLEATNRLTYAVEERKGAALLTGEYGCGKTVISRQLFEVLPQDKYDIALITNPLLTPAEMLREICIQLGLKKTKSRLKTQLMSLLNECLYENMRKNKDTVIIVDEAQAIKNPMTVEELRLLLNFQLNNRFLLTLILIGQPELRVMIDGFKQLKQRLAISYHLNPLNKEETKKYILHRLKIAGVEREIFADDINAMIWEVSEGVPRVINTACDMCLLLGFTKGKKKIDEGLAKLAFSDIEN